MKEDEIRQLRNELEDLSRQVHIQQEKILELRQRLSRLTSGEIPETATWSRQTRGQRFSLENFIGLRLIHFIGIIVLVIGLSIGVKYAIDRELISEGMRIILAYLAGGALYLLSLQLRKKYSLFSAILFSGGMASLYFTTYAACAYYNILPVAVAFTLMILLTFYTVFEAIRYNRQEIALLGLVGAYAIPYLISENADRPDLFFLYISLINMGVLYLSVRKLWRTVGIVAQAISWILFIGWASTQYKAEFGFFVTAIMVLFFIMFSGTVVFYKMVKKQLLLLNDVYQLVLNNVALYIASLFLFGFSLNTVGDHQLAAITFVTFIIVAVQGIFVYYSWKEELYLMRMLASLALTFFVMSIAFNWDGFTVTFLWLLTAVVVFVWGFKTQSVRSRMAGIILIGVTLVKLLLLDSATFTTIQKIVAYLVLGVLLLVVSFFYQKFRQQLFSDRD